MFTDKLKSHSLEFVFAIIFSVLVLVFIFWVSTLDRSQVPLVGVIAIVVIVGLTVFYSGVRNYFEDRKQKKLNKWLK
jgi:ABC-type enterochelin transport system permease subunit